MGDAEQTVNVGDHNPLIGLDTDRLERDMDA